MAHDHSHIASHGRLENRLFITVVLNLLISVVEVVGGVLSGSLALLSDAVHNLSDGVAIIVTYVALRLSRRPRTPRYTFGLKRAELLAAIINASSLIVISFFLIREAIGRFSDPTPVTGGIMLAVAVVGLAANLIGTMLLKKGSDGNINIRSAYIHLLSDAVSSLAVIIGGACIILFRITWIDPVLTILISLYILAEGFRIVKESVDVIMMSSPANIEMTELQKELEGVPGVHNIHHVHLWRLNDADIHFEAHIEVDDIPVSRTAEIRAAIERTLLERYHINHTTLQFESNCCARKELI
jgi:cobalt-zinc-cadmium efflux system protein